MGSIYLARDRQSGAIEVASTAKGGARFDVETELMSRLVHPSIARYVGHGTCPDGRAFLALAPLVVTDADGRFASRLRRASVELRRAAAMKRKNSHIRCKSSTS